MRTIVKTVGFDRLKRKPSAVLTIVLIIFIGCESPVSDASRPLSTVERVTSDHEQPTRHHEYWGGYSIDVPQGWTVRPDPNSPFQRLARVQSEGGEPQLDVVEFQRVFTSNTHETHALRMLSIFEENWTIRDVKSQAFRTLEGFEGTELFFCGHSGDGQELRLGMFIIEVGEVVLVLTWTGNVPESAERDAEIRELIASLRIENPEPAEQTADGMRRYDEPLGGFSCVPPAAWQVREVGLGPFRGYVSADPPETLRVITVGRNPGKATTAEEHYEQFLPDYAKVFDDQVEVLDQLPFTTDYGLSGLRFTAIVVRPADCVELRTVIYLFLAEEGALECQCVNGSDQGSVHDEEYDAFARSLRIETPPYRRAQKKSGEN